ncbi:MAG: FAD-binding oxidoreductase [Parvularculaceae bacterium]
MPATAEPTRDALDAIANAAGPGAVVAGEDLAPMLVEWRGRWRGETPLCVAPADVAAVADVVRACAAHGVAITPQGGNTGLVGGQIPTNGEALISLRRLNRIRDVSPLDNVLVAEAGVTLAAAQSAAADADRLFPLSIGSEGSCQIGGVVSTNAGGVNVLRYGGARDLVLGIEAVLPDGSVWNGLRRLRKDNTGYDLKQLFVGGEGTLGIVTAAALKLFPRPKETATFFAGFETPDAALALLARCQDESGGQTTSFELIGAPAHDLAVKNLPGARGALAAPHRWYALVELTSGRPGALRPSVEAILEGAFEAGEIADAAIAESGAQAGALWRLRHGLSEAMKPEGAAAKFDVSAPVARIPDFLARADAGVEKACPGARVIAFGHVGDGNVHYDVLQPEGARAAFEAAGPALERAVYDAVASVDGSISAEHGVGLARRDAVARLKAGPELAMMRAVKTALDPQGIMNPGKMIDDA